MRKISVILIIALGLSSCFKEADVVMDDSLFTLEIETTSDRNGQIFFDLENRTVVAQNSIYNWDMAFDCREGKFSIILNSAKGMAAYNTRSKRFEKKFEIQQYPWRFDHPCGDLNLTCIGEWGDFSFDNPQSYTEVYLINLGLRGQKTPLGFRKVQFLKFQDSSYIFHFAELNGHNESFDTIRKDPDFNFIYYSFNDGGKIRRIEPPKDDWDIVLSPYLDEHRELGPFDISVNKDFAIYDGLMQNRHKHEVSIDTVRLRDEIGYFDMDNYEWSPYTNLIGNTWNQWSAKDSSYHILKPKTYLLKNDERYYLINFDSYSKTDQFTSNFRFGVKSL